LQRSSSASPLDQPRSLQGEETVSFGFIHGNSSGEAFTQTVQNVMAQYNKKK
jgi:hypothetical protein